MVFITLTSQEKSALWIVWLFSQMYGKVSQWHAVQGPGPNQVACWSPLEVSGRESGSYGGRRDHVLPSCSFKSSQFLSEFSLVGGWQYSARTARISDGCSLVDVISSPAWVNLELHRTSEDNHHSYHSLPSDVIKRVRRLFYVDDCLKSLPGEQKAVELVGR